MKLGYSELVRSPARSSARLTMVLSASLRAFWEANAIPGVESSDITIEPEWLPDRLPILPRRIEVELQ